MTPVAVWTAKELAVKTWKTLHQWALKSTVCILGIEFSDLDDETFSSGKQGLDLIEPAADMGFWDMARRPRGPQAHGILHHGVV